MRIALTGATGFLGRHLVRQLVEDGHTLRCWYREEVKRNRVPESVEWQRGTLDDADARRQLVDGVDAVVHAALSWPAARRGSDREDFVEFVETNLLGSLMLMHEAYQANVPRFIFISSCAVHDEILSDRPLDEAHPLWPHSHYGAYKAAIEKFVHSFGLGQGWCVCSLRPTGIYGLADPPSSSRWYETVECVLRGDPIESAKGGKEVHASDVAKAVALLLNIDEDTIRGQAYNCYDLYVSEQHVAEIACEIAGVECAIADQNVGPKNQIETGKLRGLGMRFGGEALLRQAIGELVEACRRG
ncbi:MAG: NAD(P)-dependent oxidoreductase [Phycisphaerae bacterium]|nr:NAD(P)-dependent oxidoreductase [Phycisphaerae bacterium]